MKTQSITFYFNPALYKIVIPRVLLILFAITILGGCASSPPRCETFYNLRNVVTVNYLDRNWPDMQKMSSIQAVKIVKQAIQSEMGQNNNAANFHIVSINEREIVYYLDKHYTGYLSATRGYYESPHYAPVRCKLVFSDICDLYLYQVQDKQNSSCPKPSKRYNLTMYADTKNLRTEPFDLSIDFKDDRQSAYTCASAFLTLCPNTLPYDRDWKPARFW